MTKDDITIKRKAFIFILLMSFISLFSDMTHEGAKSLYGAYLELLGASSATIGFVSGWAQMTAYSLRPLTVYSKDKRKDYWSS